ncbi:MAG: hypothetical protein P4L88_12075 [Rhodoferax sp.]|nr:hypothetical protein [Rhodoferax sp.]
MDDLDRLCNDLNSRYGELDPMVQQVKTELEACKINETCEQAQHDWTIPYRALVKDRSSEFMRRISS